MTDGHLAATAGIDLDALYKQHIGHSHLQSLQAVFDAGFTLAVQNVVSREEDIVREYREENATLLHRFTEVYDKYCALKQQLALQNDTTSLPVEDMTQKVAAQVMDMGNVFRTAT